MHPVEFTWYKAIVLITSAFTVAIGIRNIIIFNNIRLNSLKCTEISNGESISLLWLNIILVILLSALFFWSLFRLVFSGEPTKDVVNKTFNNISHPAVSPVLTSESPVEALSPV